MDRQRRQDDTSRGALEAPYLRVLRQAQGMSRRMLERLRALHDDYPDAVPEWAIVWLDGLRRGGPQERRVALRLSDSPAEILVAPTPDPAARRKALVRDHSAGGIGLYLPEPLEVGTILWVCPVDAPDDSWVPVQVRHCKPAGPDWRVGCAFALPPV